MQMLFGLKNASGTFLQAMEVEPFSVTLQLGLVYLHTVTVFWVSTRDLANHLKQTFVAIMRCGIHLRIKTVHLLYRNSRLPSPHHVPASSVDRNSPNGYYQRFEALANIT